MINLRLRSDCIITRIDGEGPGTVMWVHGIISNHRFWAKVYPGHALNAEWEIGRSQISKLTLRQISSRKDIFNWDRGLDIEAPDSTVQEMVDFLASTLAESLFLSEGADSLAGESPACEARTSHTPGPYEYRRSSDGCDDCWEIVAECKELPLVSVPFWAEDQLWAAEAEANARLFASAPEMLDALRRADTWMMSYAGSRYTQSQMHQFLRATIAKVEGSGEAD